MQHRSACMRKVRSRSSRHWPAGEAAMRWAAVAAILIGAAAGYLALLHQLRVTEAPEEREFGAGQAEEALVQVYIEPVSVNALSHSLHGNISLAVSPALRGQSLTAPDRDLVLV